jgi:hypothetical protein
MEPKLLSITIRKSGDHLRLRWDAGQHHEAVLADFKRAFGPSQRKFSGGWWRVPTYLAFELRTWAAGYGFEIVRWEDEPARTRAAPQPPPPRPRSPRAEALRRLRLAEDAPDGLVAAALRWWSRELHPDHGGSHEAMVQLNAVRDVLCAGQRRAS